MKYLKIKTLLILGLVFVMTGCFDEFGTTFEGPFHARFTNTSGNGAENDPNPVSVSVHFAGPQQSGAITVQYSMEGTAVEGVDFTVNGTIGTLDIPAGESFGEVNLSMINNDVEDGDKTVTFTITSVSGGFEAGHGLVGKTFDFTIADDDCSPNIAGTWTAVSDFCQGDGAGGCGSGQISLTQTLVITKNTDGTYNIPDISGALYPVAYCAGVVATVADACGALSYTTPDPCYADTFTGSGIITDIDNFNLTFLNGWGDQGDVIYTRQ